MQLQGLQVWVRLSSAQVGCGHQDVDTWEAELSSWLICKAEKNVDKNGNHWKWDCGTVLQHQCLLERKEQWEKYQVWVRNEQKKIKAWFVPSVSGLLSFFLSITCSSSCSGWCIALPMWIYSPRSVWMCGSACVGQRAMVYLQQIFPLWLCQVWVDNCPPTWGTQVSSICGPNGCLRTQLQDWGSWMAEQGQRLIADVWCWSHAFLSTAI